jgi:hypothetical protein
MSRLSCGLLIVAVMLVGCKSQAPAPTQPPPPPPVTQQQFSQIRDSYQAANPNARVGLVTSVLPSANLAAVGDVPVADFKAGDFITFEDSQLNILTSGVVESTDGNVLTVKYDNPDAGGRIPAVGDLAIRAIR